MSAPEAKSASFEQIYREWMVTGAILHDLGVRTASPGGKYELNNILSRWIVSLAQSSGDSPANTVYGQLSADADMPANTKMATELAEKKVVESTDAAHKLAREIIQRVVALRDSKSLLREEVMPCVIRKGHMECVACASFSYPATPRSSVLLAAFGTRAVVASALLHSTLPDSGQQWGLPQAHADDLYALGVRNEAFASPFDSRFAGKLDARYCSLFAADKALGSTGNFFGTNMLDHAGDWQINPPFVESILAAAAKKALAAVTAAAEQKKELTVWFLMPDWTDSECYRTLFETPYARLRSRLWGFFLEKPDGTTFLSRTTFVYFVLSSAAIPDERMSKIEAVVRGLCGQKETRKDKSLKSRT